MDDTALLRRGLSAAIRTMRDVGLFDGRVPESSSYFDDAGEPRAVPFVAHPGDAVVAWYADRRVFGGISVCRSGSGGFPVDALVGWVDTASKTFQWAYADTAVFSPINDLAINVLMYAMIHVPPTADPVWLTIGDYAVASRVKSIGIPNMSELRDEIELETRRHQFWEATREEFVRVTWHPERMWDWCLDECEKSELTTENSS